ncbi:DUF4192 domain-containing protein [Paenarthrobacter sp. NPDC089675]|uniref:DUF4192 domain-containing protein n=1 Tax=Paenarthrobacter sp. NPDC089675 TaxID=3364376 RepID=UPI0038078B06
MTTKETLSIHQPEDILGYIPHLLGYWPEDSLVAITMQGRHLGATLRVDLPSSASPGVRASFSDYVRNHLLSDHQADGVVLAFYVDEGWDDGSVICRAMPFLVSLHQSLEAVGLPVRDAWFIGSTYWRSAFCSDPDCCPVPGLPVEQIRNSRINAELIYRGSTVGSSPASKDNPPVIALGREADPSVLEAERRFTEQLEDAWQSELCFDAVLAVWRQVLSRAVSRDLAGLRDPAGSLEPRTSGGSMPSLLDGPAGRDLAGFLRATLTVPAWRDAVMVMAAAGPASAKAGAGSFKLFSDEVSQTLPFDVLELGLAAAEAEPDSSAGGGLRAINSGEGASAFSRRGAVGPAAPCS